MTSVDKLGDVGGADFHHASDLQGSKVVFTGRLSEVTRSEVKTLVEDQGGKVTNNVSQQSDVLVVGENPGSEKIEFLDDHDVPTLTEVEFYSLFSNRFNDVEGVTANKPDQSALSDDRRGTLTIEIDSFVLRLTELKAKNEGEELVSLIERSTRGLLKQVIDEESMDLVEFDNGERLDVSLPPNLLAMIETAVETTSDMETPEEFVVKALHSELGFDSSETQELTLPLPESVITFLGNLSKTEDDHNLDRLAAQLLYDGLSERLETE